MSQTVIGFFDDHSDAKRAVDRLQSSGISPNRVDVSGGSGAANAGYGNLSTSNTSSDRNAADAPNPVSGSTRDENSVRRTADDRTVDPEGRNTNKFTDFFNNLFGGSDNTERDRYSHVASRSGAVVTVHANSREEAEHAANILDECGAVDVDEKASQYGYSDAQGLGRSGEASNLSSTDSLGQRSGDEGARFRSRIFDRRLNDDMRLRESGFENSGPGAGERTGNV